MMILTLHNLAKTYKMLPSEALDRASTFDLYVLDTFHRYCKYQEEVSNNKSKGLAPPTKKLSVEQMQEMVKRAKDFKPKERSK